MTTDVVLDASALIDMLLDDRVAIPPGQLHSHAGLDVEVLSVLRRLVLKDQLPAHAARELIDDLLALEIIRHPLTRTLPRVWMMRHDITAYDAAYVALAEALDLPLMTLDRRLAKTAARYCAVVAPE